MINYVSFPNLGLEFNINPVAFSIGAKNIYWYGIIMAISYFAGIFYALKRCNNFGIEEETISDSILIIVPVSLICARLYYVMFSLHLYDSFWDIFKVWEGGIAIYGGVIGGALGLFITSKWKKIKFISFLDLGACSLLLGQAIGRWGNFVNAEAYGSQTDSLFMMSFGTEIGYHPTFLYESVWNFLGFIAMYIISKHFYKFEGQMSLIYLIWYGFGRTFIEGLRVDSLWFGNFRVSQVLAFITFVFASILLIYLLKKPKIIKKNQKIELLEEVKEDENENT